ncbi:MAG: alkaline phosphatase family protein [Anaerolineae bacterium]|nr:alkaline phosphatase family protein [Anaerolineae bacterium]
MVRGAGSHCAFAIVQIDGLPRAVLESAIRRGIMPHLARLLRLRRYRLTGWRCGLPSTTTAFQAGFFYGTRDIPGFRWYDKIRGEVVTSHRPDQMRDLQAELESHAPGLLQGGVTHTSLLSGGADHVVFTLSKVLDVQLQTYLQDTGLLLSFLFHPLRVARLLWYTGVGFLQRLRPGAVPRRFRPLPLTRLFVEAWVDAMFTEFMTFGVLVDLHRETPRLYANFTGYDEAAHRYGLLSDEAFWALRWIDSRVAEIERACSTQSEGCRHFYLLSDHGMAVSHPFRSRFAKSLEEVISQSVSTGVSVGPLPLAEAVMRYQRVQYLDSELLRVQQALPVWCQRLLERTRRPLLAYLRSEEPSYDWDKGHDIVVQFSGPLAHIYFLVSSRPMDLPEVIFLFPRLAQRLVAHAGVEVVVGRDGDCLVILGRGGGVLTCMGDSESLDGPDPLVRFPDRRYVIHELSHLLSLRQSGDLVVLGRIEAGGAVITFEDQYATHGGIGGGQLEAFLVYPADLEQPPLGINSPEALHHWFAERYQMRRDGIPG